MGASSGFRDLEVWQRSMDLVDQVYKQTRQMPPAEFDLKRQIRKASVSIPSNVAEGNRRMRQLAYQNHVGIALGSQGELETELEVAFRNDLLGRHDCENIIDLLDRVGAMLFRLHESLGPTGS
jgi:four helix bundle protein